MGAHYVHVHVYPLFDLIQSIDAGIFLAIRLV